MPRMRRPAIALACVLALLAAAGCGGSSSSTAAGTESAATVAPASAAAYVAVDTDIDSSQWKQALDLLDRFPGKDRLLRQLAKELGQENLDFEEDIEPALGPETAIVVLTGHNDVVGLTQPDDQAKLDALLKQINEDEDENYVTREIDGWTAIADTNQVLDAFDTARKDGTLEDDGTFQDAVGDLPDEALVKAYVSGDAIDKAASDASGATTGALTGGGTLESVGLAVETRDDGVGFSGSAHVEGGDRPAAWEPKLLDRVPDDALAVFSFKDLASGLDQATSNPRLGPQLGQIEQAFGVKLEDITKLFSGESVVYARVGTPIPEVTVLLDVDNEQAALATLDKLAARAVALADARAGSVEVDGKTVKYVEIQGIRISYGAFDGIVAVTSGAAGIRDAQAGGDKLPDDDRFKAAKEAAGMGDTTNGFFYVDLKDSIPLITGLAGVAGADVPLEVTENLEPLESFFVYSALDGDVVKFGGHVGIAK
jgi:Protein of unknown function (DUF3352)